MSRYIGSKNRQSNPGVHDIPGAATSACKVNRRPGFRDNSRIAWFERGRPIKWEEVFSSVERAYDKWRVKMAERGIKIMDGWEHIAADSKVEKQDARRMAL